MTLPIGPANFGASPGTAAAGHVDSPEAAKTKEKLAQAAREFDAVFVRIVLKSLEKTTKLGGSSSMNAGQSAYGSMVVDSVADAVARAGGTGLADRLIEALGPRIAEPETKPAPGGADPASPASPKPLEPPR
ncbi:MAG TPA: hypothetical protein VHE30_06945 [Polyangiaceae bacterium]|nr:hypothetical protein [Polyangiaceae bacterium]